jgi:hypothetical protein
MINIFGKKSIPYVKPSIYREFYIMKIIEKIKKKFYNFLYEQIENYPLLYIILDDKEKLNDYIQKWCWYQYNLPGSVHNVIPIVKSGNYTWDRIINDIAYVIKCDTFIDILKSKKLENFNTLIHTYLLKKYDKIVNLPNNNNFEMIKLFIDDKIQKVSFEFIDNNKIKNNRCKILIVKKVYDKLKNKLLMNKKNYNNEISFDENSINEIIFCLCLRYEYLDSNNQQLAIIDDIKDIFKNIGFNFDLFGSAINTYSDQYCSLFGDIEKYFGSQGNFFDMDIKSGLYICNPPYDETIMSNATDEIINWITTNRNLIFLVTIPVWDEKTQNNIKYNFSKSKHSKLDYNKDRKKDEFKDYYSYSNLKPYIKRELIIPKNRIPYFNYKKNKYIYAVNTYLLLIHNNNIDKSYEPILDKINESFITINNNDIKNMYINKKV